MEFRERRRKNHPATADFEAFDPASGKQPAHVAGVDFGTLGGGGWREEAWHGVNIIAEWGLV